MRALALGASSFSLAAAGALGCLVVYDFDGYNVAPVDGGAGSSGSGSGGAGSSSAGSGGEGGSTCGGADLLKDAENCGGCGVSCAGGTCNSGVCTPFSFNLGVPLKTVAALDDVVFVLRTDHILVTLPVEFDGASQQGLMFDVCDHVGFLSREGDHIYYRPQNGTKECGPDEYLFTCGAEMACTKTTHTIPSHMNGVAIANNIFYFVTPSPSQIHGASLGPNGVPSETEIAPIPVPDMENMGGGAYLLAHDPAGGALWWTTYQSGCVYKVLLADLPLLVQAMCFPETVPSPERLIVAPGSGIYVGSFDNNIYQVNPIENPGPAKVFAGPTHTLLGADESFVFAFDSTPPSGLVALRRGNGTERARVPTSLPIQPLSADTGLAKYVFYVMGNELFRWRKPPTP